MPISFWGHVRAVTEALGSAERRADSISAFTLDDVDRGLAKAGRPTRSLRDGEQPSRLARTLTDYFEYRAHVLNAQVRHDLMVVTEAKELFEQTLARLGARGPQDVHGRKGVKIAEEYSLPSGSVRVQMNKQKREKRSPAPRGVSRSR
jgi:hypothetical protein